MVTSRLQKLRGEIKRLGLEAVLITNGYNRKYITGFTGTSGYVLVTESRAVLFTDFRYMSQAREQAIGFEVMEHLPDPFVTLKDALNELHVKRLGFEEHDMTFATYQSARGKLAGIELAATDHLVEKIRRIKDEGELQIMRRAAELADRTFAHLVGNVLKPGISERDIALEIEFFVRQNGATSTSFDTIVASGERSALPHGVASDRILAGNEFVKLDFGAYYKGYCSDITRTVVLGKPTEKHREIYDIVLEAQLHALEHIKPGMTGKQADALARDVIGKYGYGDKFGHGTGHGIGMEIHESPRLNMQDDTVLEPGMVVTVEPGIYLPGFGGVRIEDDIVITATGIEVITKASKTFTIID
ncbi:MAG TPA: Xaa-Pro peptidase family protein [Bacilli bacterium]